MENKKELIINTYLEELSEVLKIDGQVNIDLFEEARLRGTEEDEDRDLKVEAVTKIVNTYKRIMKEEMITLLIDNLD